MPIYHLKLCPLNIPSIIILVTLIANQLSLFGNQLTSSQILKILTDFYGIFNVYSDAHISTAFLSPTQMISLYTSYNFAALVISSLKFANQLDDSYYLLPYLPQAHKPGIHALQGFPRLRKSLLKPTRYSSLHTCNKFLDSNNQLYLLS